MSKISTKPSTWAEIRTLNSSRLAELKAKKGKKGTIIFKLRAESDFDFRIISDGQYQEYHDIFLENKRLKAQIDIIRNTVCL